jgi:hypothetical protein
MQDLVLSKELVFNSIFTILFFNLFLILGILNFIKSFYLFQFCKSKFFPGMTILYSLFLFMCALNVGIYNIFFFCCASVLYFLISLKIG